MNDFFNRNSFLTFFLLCGLLLSFSANAFYEDCVFSWEFGESRRRIVKVMPLGEVCYSRCDRECKAFSRKAFGVELNQDIIDQCIMDCQRGVPYSSRIREQNPDTTQWYNYLWKESVTIGSSCSPPGSKASDSAENSYYPVGVEVSPGQEVYFSVFNSPGFEGNTIYMCGKKTVTIYPTIYSFDYSVWESKKYLWQNRNSSVTTWNARNPYWTDTGIDVKDGDFLSITLGWGYRSLCEDGDCRGIPTYYSLFVRAPYTNKWNSEAAVYLPGSDLKVPKFDGNGNLDISYDQAMKYNEKITFYGLTNQVWEDVRRKVIVDYLREEYRTNGINYIGYLKGFSEKWTRFGIMHLDGGDSDNWDDNLGGAHVEITWKGCPYNNGERLQYALIPKKLSQDRLVNLLNVDIKWYDVPQDAIKKREIVKVEGEERGDLYLRIKPLEYQAELAPDCPYSESICKESHQNVQSSYGVHNTEGHYFVEVEVVNDIGEVSSFVSDIINQVRSYLFGSGSKQGKVQKIFNRMVAGSKLVEAIRALLTLYIAYTGLSFIIGIAQITQKDAAIRFVKIGIVIALISPNSWEFFNTYLFTLFTDGALELIANVAAPINIPPSLLKQIQNDPELIFSIFDKPFWQIFSRDVWIKISALILSNFLGFFVAIIVIIATIIYVLSIGKAILIYLISLIGIAILLLVAPIFISMVLFNYTKAMFEAWLKQLLSFTLQPVMVFGFIVMLNNLLMIGLYTSLNFTACKVCLLGFDLSPIVDICLIPAWTTMIDMHYPADAFLGMPITLIGAIIFFFIIAQATYVMIGYCASVAAQLATSGWISLDLASVAQQANPFIKTAETVSELTGIDKNTKDTRDAMRKSWAENVSQPYKEAHEAERNPNPTSTQPDNPGNKTSNKDKGEIG